MMAKRLKKVSFLLIGVAICMIIIYKIVHLNVDTIVYLQSQEQAGWMQDMKKGPNIGHVKLQDTEVYLLSAFASNSSRDANPPWDKFVINGWEHLFSHRAKVIYKCCFLSKSSDIQYNMMNSNSSGFPLSTVLTAKQFTCNTIGLDSSFIQFVTLAKPEHDCPTSKDLYLPVKYIHSPQRTTFAVCGKLIYDQKDAEQLIEWIEVQKLFGVDKILVYPLHNLNKNAVNVLRYYELSGLVEIVPFYNVPAEDKYKRDFSQENVLLFNDNQVIVYDCEERLKEYTYAILMDTDEYVIPTDLKIISYIQLMDTLLEKEPNGSGFFFADHLHITSWGKTNININDKDNTNDNDDDLSSLYITQYLNRTVEIIDRPKMIFVPDRVEQGSLTIHMLNPAPGYRELISVPVYMAVLKHFRSCRAEWGEACYKNFTRITDYSMTRIAWRILPSVIRTRTSLGLR